MESGGEESRPGGLLRVPVACSRESFSRGTPISRLPVRKGGGACFAAGAAAVLPAEVTLFSTRCWSSARPERRTIFRSLRGEALINRLHPLQSGKGPWTNEGRRCGVRVVSAARIIRSAQATSARGFRGVDRLRTDFGVSCGWFFQVGVVK